MPGMKRPGIGPARYQVEHGGIGGIGEGLQPEKARPCIDQSRSIGEGGSDRVLQTVSDPEPRYRQNHEAGPLQKQGDRAADVGGVIVGAGITPGVVTEGRPANYHPHPSVRPPSLRDEARRVMPVEQHRHRDAEQLRPPTRAAYRFS